MKENTLHKKQFAVIGIGNIGRILIGRLQAAGIPASQIVGCNTQPERSAAASDALGVRIGTLADETLCSADIICLATPPGTVLAVLQTLSPRLHLDQVVISFAAAIPLQALEALTPEGAAVVRVMPNAPSLVGQGMNPVTYGKAVDSQQKAVVEELLAALGKTVEVRDEQMNWCVGLSGAAMRSLLPALAGMTQAGVEAGLSNEDARGLAAQVMLGTAALVLQSGLSIEQIKALTPMETVDEAAVEQIFTQAAREAKEKIDRLQNKLWTAAAAPSR